MNAGSELRSASGSIIGTSDLEVKGSRKHLKAIRVTSAAEGGHTWVAYPVCYLLLPQVVGDTVREAMQAPALKCTVGRQGKATGLRREMPRVFKNSWHPMELDSHYICLKDDVTLATYLEFCLENISSPPSTPTIQGQCFYI